MMVSKFENETIINFNEGDDFVSIYTRSLPVYRKCKKMGLEIVETFKSKNAKGVYVETGWDFNILKKDFRFYRKRKVIVTEKMKNRGKALSESRHNAQS